MKSKIVLWLLIGWHISKKVRKVRTYRRYSLRRYGYWSLRAELWYWLERHQGHLYNFLCNHISEDVGERFGRVRTPFYVRRKDAERAASERVAR